MQEVFEKIKNNLEREVLGKPTPEEFDNGIYKAIKIVNQVAEEYNGSEIYQLAMIYAEKIMKYGLDITERRETATSQSAALERAYMRGMQEQIDKFNQLKEEYNNGWIPVSEKLPEEHELYDITFKNDAGIHSDSAIYEPFSGNWYWCDDETELLEEDKVLAWAEKREPYQPKGDKE